MLSILGICTPEPADTFGECYGDEESDDFLPPPPSAASRENVTTSRRLAYGILQAALRHINDPNVLPHLHTWLAFIVYHKPMTSLVKNEFPWESLVAMLNLLVKSVGDENFERFKFPVPIGGPLPEDYILRGFSWSRCYFPERWVEGTPVDMSVVRVERILWLAWRIAIVSFDHRPTWI